MSRMLARAAEVTSSTRILDTINESETESEEEAMRVEGRDSVVYEDAPEAPQEEYEPMPKVRHSPPSSPTQPSPSGRVRISYSLDYGSLVRDRQSSSRNQNLDISSKGGATVSPSISSIIYRSTIESLDALSDELHQVPSPVFSHAAPTAKLSRVEEPATPLIDDFQAFDARLVPTESIPPAYLDVDGMKSPISPASLRKKARKRSTVPSPSKIRSVDENGIDHSFSPPLQPFEGPKGDTAASPSSSDYKIYAAAKLPAEPDPSRFLGGLNFMDRLITPIVPTCHHFPRWCLYTGPPPDLTPPDLETTTSTRHDIDLCEQEYLSTTAFSNIKPTLSPIYMSTILANVTENSSDNEISYQVEKLRDWGLEYITEQLLRRLLIRYDQDKGLMPKLEAECDSDDDDDTPRNSIDAPDRPQQEKELEEPNRGEQPASVWSREMAMLDEAQLDEYVKSLKRMPKEYGDGEDIDADSNYQVAFDQITSRLEQDEVDKMSPRARDHDRLPAGEGGEPEQVYVGGSGGMLLRGSGAQSRGPVAYPPQLSPSEQKTAVGSTICRDSTETSAPASQSPANLPPDSLEKENKPPPVPPRTRPSRSATLPASSATQLSSVAPRQVSASLSDPSSSVSTSSSERLRRSSLGIGFAGTSRGWSPHKSKSTASLGCSVGESILGKMSASRARSPTRALWEVEQVENGLYAENEQASAADRTGTDEYGDEDEETDELYKLSTPPKTPSFAKIQPEMAQILPQPKSILKNPTTSTSDDDNSLKS